MDEVITKIIIPAVSLIVTLIIRKHFAGDEYSFSWLAWLSFSAVGGAIGAIYFLAVQGTAIGLFGAWATYGACVGIFQAIALGQFLERRFLWAVGALIGWSIVPIAGSNIRIGVLLASLLVGILQAPALDVEIGNSILWVLINGLVWPIMIFMVVFPFARAFGPILGDYVSFIFGTALGTLAGSLATGAFVSTQV